jgi:hypothetical protein
MRLAAHPGSLVELRVSDGRIQGTDAEVPAPNIDWHAGLFLVTHEKKVDLVDPRQSLICGIHPLAAHLATARGQSNRPTWFGASNDAQLVHGLSQRLGNGDHTVGVELGVGLFEASNTHLDIPDEAAVSAEKLTGRLAFGGSYLPRLLPCLALVERQRPRHLPPWLWLLLAPLAKRDESTPVGREGHIGHAGQRDRGSGENHGRASYHG